MGNLCIVDDNHYDEYRFKKYKCIKCGDKFTKHKNNTRLHCRLHRMNCNGVCIDCGVNINTHGNRNCHHTRKINWYSEFI